MLHCPTWTYLKVLVLISNIVLNVHEPREVEMSMLSFDQKRKPGRKPKKGPKRVENILIKVTETEKVTTWNAAHEYRMTLSDFVRRCIVEVIENGFTEDVKK